MDPLTLIATAVALGASEGARETAQRAVSDAYGALKGYITSRYGRAAADVEGVESEPDEELRRQLLAKKLGQAGAAEDADLFALAQELVRQVAEHAPGAAATVGVELTRVDAVGNIAITDVDTQGGTGVRAEDVSAGGDITISGVRATAPGEPPHPR